MTIQEIAFYIFSSVAIIASLMVVSARNPVHSVLFLIVVFFNAAGLFLLAGAEFLALILLIVYVGAVAVLFLFVVMMMDINFATIRQGFVRYFPFAGLVGLILLAEIIFAITSIPDVGGRATLGGVAHPIPDPQQVSNAHALGRILYTDYFYVFQLAGIVLLVAMIGAIVLTLRERPGSKHQNIGRQSYRSSSDTLQLIQDKPSGQGVHNG
ncbi:MAG: NADH-quinone oxidoreductase subunit J [Alphaproteobacteria bacterium]|nr:NADH-quinone oxidoreductase subunit J [Alphaproteobacteria bacterium]